MKDNRERMECCPDCGSDDLDGEGTCLECEERELDEAIFGEPDE